MSIRTNEDPAKASLVRGIGDSPHQLHYFVPAPSRAGIVQPVHGHRLIIYHCFGAAHSSVTAAAIHLGLLGTDRTPQAKELNQIPFFDRQIRENHGHLLKMGTDEWNNIVYVWGRKSYDLVLIRFLVGLGEAFELDVSQIVFASAIQCVNMYMICGGSLSRGFGVVQFGRPLVTWGTIRAFRGLCNLVDQVKMYLYKMDGSPQ